MRQANSLRRPHNQMRFRQVDNKASPLQLAGESKTLPPRTPARKIWRQSPKFKVSRRTKANQFHRQKKHRRTWCRTHFLRGGVIPSSTARRIPGFAWPIGIRCHLLSLVDYLRALLLGEFLLPAHFRSSGMAQAEYPKLKTWSGKRSGLGVTKKETNLDLLGETFRLAQAKFHAAECPIFERLNAHDPSVEILEVNQLASRRVSLTKIEAWNFTARSRERPSRILPNKFPNIDEGSKLPKEYKKSARQRPRNS